VQIQFEHEPWDGSQTVREAGEGYCRKPADQFTDRPARLTPRQMNFYRNLMSIALCLGSATVPVDFEDTRGRRMYLDRGCIKIAAHAGFIEPLSNDQSGVVSEIRLRWRVDGTTG